MDTIITLSDRLQPRKLTNHSAQNVLDYLSSFWLSRNNFTFYTKEVLLSVLLEFKHAEFFTSYGGYLLNTKRYVPSVGFSVAGLDRAKLGVYQFQSFLFIIVIVKSILLKPTF